MRIGLVTDSLAHLPLEELLPIAAAAGITMLEFGCGNWSPAPHLDIERLLASEAERADLLSVLSGLGLSISAQCGRRFGARVDRRNSDGPSGGAFSCG